MEKQASIVENSPNFIMYLTADGSVSYVNPAAVMMSGYMKTDIIAAGLELIFDLQTVQDIKEKNISNTLKYGSDNFEVNMRQRNNKTRTLIFSSFVMGSNDVGVIAQDITKMRELEMAVDKIYYDALTEIYNRRFFDENLERIVKYLYRSGSVLSLMMIDIDYFKSYNDTYGHSEGDHCLKIVSETLSKSITRIGDFVARYGGEEFAVVLPHTNEGGARVVANKLLKNIRDCNIPHEKSDVADCVTVSIGVTTGNVVNSHCGGEYIKLADEMLYKSKQDGRNRYTFAIFGE